jgi:ArsR family transcriptional regulator
MEREQKSSIAETQANVFKALANPSRLRILSLLSQHEELCVCELEAALGHKQPLTSYHLAVLEDAGLVTHREKGTWSYYKLRKEKLRELLSPQCCEFLIKELRYE